MIIYDGHVFHDMNVDKGDEIMKYYELAPVHDARASFYGKALVFDLGGGILELHSYGTPVARIYKATDSVELLDAWSRSATTLRHVKEFLKQSGFTAESKAQIERDYV